MLEPANERCWIEIDTSLIDHNVKEVEKLMGNTKIMGIVKANAYGHDAVLCARELIKSGVDYFGVASIDEAIELRKAGVEYPILILGYTPPKRAQELVDYRLDQSLLSADYARKLSALAKKMNTAIHGHVKVDTGMNRTGVLYQDGEKHFDEIEEIYRLDGLKVDGIFSHFPVSDDLEEESTAFTEHQMDLFDEVLKRLKEKKIDPGLRHIQNSYGILNYGDRGYDYCRPGLLYMGVTSDDAIGITSNPDLIPILSLKAKVSMVKTIPAGATVSYGRHYTAQNPAKIASLSIGYADGLPRLCSNRDLMVSIRGHLVPVVGNICMDQCMADISGYDDIEEGDIVTVIGRDGENILTVDTISRLSNTINNETLTRFTARVPRYDLKEALQ